MNGCWPSHARCQPKHALFEALSNEQRNRPQAQAFSGSFDALSLPMGRQFNRRLRTSALIAALLWCRALSWSQIVPTGYGLDLAINGIGWFIVRDPTTGQMFVTRSGPFHLDANGYVVTGIGQLLQGYKDSTLSILGDKYQALLERSGQEALVVSTSE